MSGVCKILFVLPYILIIHDIGQTSGCGDDTIISEQLSTRQMYVNIQGVSSRSVKKCYIVSPEVPHVQQRLDPITRNEIHMCDKDNA